MKILFVISCINFNGGAHIATLELIDALKGRGIVVDVLTDSEPSEERAKRLAGSNIYLMRPSRYDLSWFVRGCFTRMFKAGWHPAWTIDPSGKWRNFVSMYDTVAMVGENSLLRWFVGIVNGPRKVAYIHTDYKSWIERDPMSGFGDARLYKRYDCIAVVGKKNADKFANFYPSLRSKTVPFLNVLKTNKPGRKPVMECNCEQCRLVTLTRIDREAKCFPLYIEVAMKLKRMGCKFRWTIFGGGSLFNEANRMISDYGIGDIVSLPGFDEDARSKVADFDLFVLLSDYEGMPNVIFESLIAGTPVFATDVGGISEQVDDGRTGRLVPYDKSKILEGLKNVIENGELVKTWRQNLVGYSYDNEKIIDEHCRILNAI